MDQIEVFHLVKVYGSGIKEALTCQVREGDNLLSSCMDQGAPMNFFCNSGKCATCVVQVMEGNEHLSEFSFNERYRLGEKLQSGYRLACQTFVYGDAMIKLG